MSRNAKILVGACAAAVFFVAFVVLVGDDEDRTAELVWITEKTTRAPGSVPDALRDRIDGLTADGGVRLVVHAVGERVGQVTSTDLDVVQDGERVTDQDIRQGVVEGKLTEIEEMLASVPVGRQGFSLYAALRTAADEAARAGGPTEVWLSTTVLSGSTDPLSIPALTEAEVDPSQAVAELMKGSLRDLDLSRVRLRVVMLTPVGDGQRELSPRSESWRASFITTLAEELGATVGEPLRDNATASPWRRASEVPAIEPMVERTPEVALPPQGGASPASPRIDSAAFQPNTAELVDPDATRQVVAQIVDAYRQNPGRYRFDVVGYCSRFGDAGGARKISLDRADAISVLLVEEGVPGRDITTAGKGFDELADPAQDPESRAQRVVVIHLLPR